MAQEGHSWAKYNLGWAAVPGRDTEGGHRPAPASGLPVPGPGCHLHCLGLEPGAQETLPAVPSAPYQAPASLTLRVASQGSGTQTWLFRPGSAPVPTVCHRDGLSLNSH